MEKDIDRITKNSETDIVIRMDDFNGKKGITIREFVKSDKYTGFTKAGTRIPADKFAIFKAAINSINEKELMEAAESKPDPKYSGRSSGNSNSFGNNGSSSTFGQNKFGSSKPSSKKQIDEIEDQEF
ncbi:MAG TPA: hypothetical protein VHA12_04470 [Candidatus Nanoarchaeia archaeon]|nr:hypothetical protein [Candidatus Nanoarchaeia archaeon]